MLVSRPAMRQVLRFASLTALFTLLHYIGAALFLFGDRITTVKPYGGVALALILIYGRGWKWPVLAAGTLGGVMAKVGTGPNLFESLTIPFLTSGLLLAMDHLCRRLIGNRIDFRAWRQLVRFITIAAAIGALSACLYVLDQRVWGSSHPWRDWQAWFISVTLSYVAFTPVTVLLATMPKGLARRNWPRLAASAAILAAALAAAFIPSGLPLLFILPLALLVITMMCEIEGAALGLAATLLVLTVGTAMGHGPASIAHLSPGYQIFFIQVMVSVMIAVMLPAAAAITERRKLRDRLEAALRREARANRALRDSEQQALRLAGEAQRANHAKSEFLASMSHELRTPLNAILGFSDIIRGEFYGPLGHFKYGEYANDVHNSGAHLLDLINDILDLSKIDAGKMELRESIFGVDELIGECVTLLREKAKGHVSLEHRPHPAVLVRADRRLVKQILINLLGNAIKFTPAAGSVTVGMMETNGPDAGLEIYVADTGIGMTPHQLEKAFSVYGQVNSRIARAEEGTGLGLPISQSLARLHGGEILAHSTPGRGTRMAFFLPANRILSTEAEAAAV